MRRTAIVVVVVLAIAAVPGFFVLEAWLDDVRARPAADARAALASALLSSTAALSLLIFGTGWHLYRLGAAARRTGSFPPPRARVLRDTVVFGGSKARLHGTVLLTIGATLMVLAVALVLFCLRLVRLLEGGSV